MKRIDSIGLSDLLNRILFLTFFIALVVSPVLVKGVDAQETVKKLPAGIKEYSECSISLYKSVPKTYSKHNIPQFILLNDKEPVIFIHSGTNMIIYNYLESKVIRTLVTEPMYIMGLDYAEASNKCYVFFEKKQTRKVTDYFVGRLDLTTGKLDWSVQYKFTSMYYVPNAVERKIEFYSYKVLVNDVPEKKQLRILGLKPPHKYKNYFGPQKYKNRMMILDSETGQVISDKEFDFRRYFNGKAEFFIKADTREYELIDIPSFTCLLKGKFHAIELPFFKYHALGIQQVDWEKRSHIMQLDEFITYPIEGGFILAVRQGCKTCGIKSSQWVIFDIKGKKVKEVCPAPLTSMDLAIVNLGDSKWPVYLPVFRKKCTDRMCKIIALNKDGSYSEYDLPTLEGVKNYQYEFWQNWFHDGDIFYYYDERNLYRFRLGESTGELIYQGKKWSWIKSYSNSEYLILSNYKVIRLSDGKEFTLEEIKDKLNPKIWKKSLNLKQKNESHILEPEGIPKFKRYALYYYKQHYEGVIEKRYLDKYEYLDPIRFVLKVWGNYRSTGNYGDIGIVPAVLKHKSYMLIGFNLANNRPLFHVPIHAITRFKKFKENLNAFPTGFYLPFNVVTLNDNEALLIVLEEIDKLKTYKLIRPS